MYGILLAYSFILGLLSYAVFRREVWLLILFFLFFEIGVYSTYNYYRIRWNFPKRVAFTTIYFLGYFSLFLFYGNRIMSNDFIIDKL